MRVSRRGVSRGTSAMVIVIVMIMLLVAQAGAAPPQPGAQRKIVVTAAPFLAHAPFFLAQANGDFEKEGVSVEFIRVGRSADSMVALVSGHADVLLGNVTVGLLNMVARGEAPRIVADKGYAPSKACVDRAVLVRKDIASRLKTRDGARGLRTVVSMASPSAFHLDLQMKELGLTLDDLTLLEVPNPEIAGAFQTGAIDMAHAGEPWFSQSLRTGKVEVWKGGDPGVPGGVVLFASRLLAKDRDQGLRFLRGYLRGVMRLREGKTPGNVEALMKSTGLDRPLIEGACWPEVSADSRIDSAPLKAFAAWAWKRGYMDGYLDVSRAIDLSLLEEISRPKPARRAVPGGE